MLEQRIIDTLRLFAAQHMAATLLEVHRYLVRDAGALDLATDGLGNLMEEVEGEAREAVSSVARGLDNLVVRKQVVERSGYFTLPGNEEYFEKRWRGYQFGVQRERRIRRFIRGFQYLPFVRGVAIAGSQAMGVQRKESDIDLLVITKGGWLWLPRTVVTAYFQVLGMRRYAAKIANRVCLNHYVAGPKAMKTGRNWYTALEYAKLRPVFGNAAIADFQHVNKAWIQSFFPNFFIAQAGRAHRSRVQKVLEWLLTATVGQFLERLLGSWQAKRIHKEEKHIIVTEDELSFHPNSKQDALLKALSSHV